MKLRLLKTLSNSFSKPIIQYCTSPIIEQIAINLQKSIKWVIHNRISYKIYGNKRDKYFINKMIQLHIIPPLTNKDKSKMILKSKQSVKLYEW